MKFIHCLLTGAFLLPLLVASDKLDAKRKVDTQELEAAQQGSLKGSSRGDDHEDVDSPRLLTWSHWSWYQNKKKRPSNNNPTFPSANIGTAGCGGCPSEEFEFNAFMGNSLSSAASVNEIGGKYVYNRFLSRNAALSEPFEDNSAVITGDCTRFQNLEITADGNRILGAGLCTFIITVVNSNMNGSMILQGELFDVIPSMFSITGGTGAFDGSRGKVEFTPFYDNGGTDVFTEASHVELTVDARIL